MTKDKRLKVYTKYNGHCAYCGKEIAIKDMQVDHLVPQNGWYRDPKDAPSKEYIESLENLMPSCGRCNHYKRVSKLESFRVLMKTLHERTQKIYINKVAEDYGIIKIEPWDGKFYFERVSEE